MFGLLRITAFGDYAIDGDPAQNSVDIDTALSFDELVSPHRRWESSMITNPSFPRSSGTGTWSGLAVIDVGPESVEAVRLTYSIGLLAVSGPGGSAQLHCHGEGAGGFELRIGMVPVPEPATLALLAAGGLLVGHRGRRAWDE